MLRVAAIAVALVGLAGCASAEVADTVSTSVTSPADDPPTVTTSSEVPVHAPDSSTASPPATAELPDDELHFVGRADLNATGNRIVLGRGTLDEPPVVVELAAPPRWVVPKGPGRGDGWVIALEGGSIVLWSEDDGLRTINDRWESEPFAFSEGVGVLSPTSGQSMFDNPLPDGRVVQSRDAGVSVALVDPTDRYAHGVLGDDLEASGLEILRDGAIRIVLEDDVIEGIAPMLADLDGGGVSEIVVTQSNGDDGARLVARNLDGDVVGESAPIGRGNRWRNQIGAGPLGPNGEIELVDIRTPHIGGTVQFFRLVDGSLQQVARQDGFTNHVIGSRNLDLAVIGDADGDGLLEVIAPADNLRELGVITRRSDESDGATVAFRVDLDGRMSTNLGAVDHPDGTTSFAAGTENGRLLIWSG